MMVIESVCDGETTEIHTIEIMFYKKKRIYLLIIFVFFLASIDADSQITAYRIGQACW